VAVPVPGLVSVAGGKYTTYRVMARDAVDAAARGLDRKVPPSVTDTTELIGAEGFRALWNRRERLAAQSGLHPRRIERLLGRHGSRIHDLLALVDERPELGRPMVGADDYLQAEALYAASHEGAHHLEDLLTRRTRISIETWDRGVEAAEPAARLMAEVLGWGEGDVAREIANYRARVQAERRSQEEPDDRAADLVRTSAPDVRAGVAAGQAS
jgi:glycerol-3-phosphate dehydrogenase